MQNEIVQKMIFSRLSFGTVDNLWYNLEKKLLPFHTFRDHDARLKNIQTGLTSINLIKLMGWLLWLIYP